MRFLAIFIIILTVTVSSATAEDKASFISKFKDFILDTPLKKEFVNPVRPSIGKDIDGCLKVNPYDHIPLIDRIGARARHMANNLDLRQKSLAFQPHFSGLKGPKITLMRRDLERALISNNGSANEIYHNALIQSPSYNACDKKVKAEWDIELKHHIDLFDSDQSPLARSDIVTNGRIHFGGYFLATASIKNRLYTNLKSDPRLLMLNRLDPVRQDIIGFAEQRLNLNRAMLSGFITPIPDLHLAGHAGVLEEAFMGLGGELLYRPHDSPWAIGGELWHAYKRLPYTGKILGVNGFSPSLTSALLNIHYDIPTTDYTIGLGGGRYLDGDLGIEARGIYRPAHGWKIEGFATLSNENDRTLNDKETNLFAGLKVTMPLGQFKGLPDNSRQTFDSKPFARDKGQRIDNPYPLYDITDPWQTRELHKYWNRVVE